ncbi:eukaryotic translation initiation factor 4E-like [Ostrinia furnacalis]|uniref:eukaryotic translation initiation factor 4E-like n=1 Tax=Ostrinia furnacalis TaxID=93504 RepID=UPI00103C8764|nr:eukaryotic translation initiation factor 4E-like [Ostrinia furnacalis]
MTNTKLPVLPPQPEKVKQEDAPAEPTKHPLENTWGMWLYAERTRNWKDDLIELTSFDTVEDYWCLYHHIKLPSELSPGCQYFVFKRGVRPEWEDAANRRGGRWLVTLEKRQCDEMDRIWVEVVLLMIGENFENANSAIRGAVVNAKAKQNKSKIGIWLADKTDEKAILKIGRKIKDELGIKWKITFHAHNSNFTMHSL